MITTRPKQSYLFWSCLVFMLKIWYNILRSNLVVLCRKMRFGKGVTMVELTRLNDTKLMVNSDLIETVEETPDTVVTLTTGRKFVVKEKKQEIRNLVISYKRNIYASDF